MKEVKVTISGLNNTGKSRITYLIKEMLKVHDFNVEFNTTPDFLNEGEFNKHMRRNFDEAISAIASQTKIVVEEKQLPISNF